MKTTSTDSERLLAALPRAVAGTTHRRGNIPILYKISPYRGIIRPQSNTTEVEPMAIIEPSMFLWLPRMATKPSMVSVRTEMAAQLRWTPFFEPRRAKIKLCFSALAQVFG